MLDYISRAQLFPTQREWFEAAAKRKQVWAALLLGHRRVLRGNILRALFEDHMGRAGKPC